MKPAAELVEVGLPGAGAATVHSPEPGTVYLQAQRCEFGQLIAVQHGVAVAWGS